MLFHMSSIIDEAALTGDIKQLGTSLAMNDVIWKNAPYRGTGSYKIAAVYAHE